MTQGRLVRLLLSPAIAFGCGLLGVPTAGVVPISPFGASAVAQEAGGLLVETGEAEAAEIRQRIRLSGSVVAPRTAILSTDVGGLVATMRVDIGDRVAAGDPVVEFDDALARVDLRRAEAASREAQAELADARRELEVGRALVARNSLPRNELDARESRVNIAAAGVARLDAEVARQRETLRRHVVTAPFAGVIANRATAEGEWVAPGSPIVELVETDGLRVDVPVPQRHFADLDPSTDITVAFDAMPGREFAATVAALVPVTDPVTRAFLLRLDPGSDDLPLAAGMSADVSLVFRTGEEGVVVPRDAVIRHPDGRTTVWLVEAENGEATVAERQVVLGRAFDGEVHVREGLAEGARVVVRGNEMLREGQRVRIPAAGR